MDFYRIIIIRIKFQNTKIFQKNNSQKCVKILFEIINFLQTTSRPRLGEIFSLFGNEILSPRCKLQTLSA